jgi:large repetitive protein
VSGASYTALAEGMHMFEVRARDAAGNLDPTPASVTWSVDTTVPNTAITSAPPAIASSTTATFAFSATEAVTFMCVLDGGAAGECSTPVTYAALAQGSHSFAVYALDAAGNADPSPATWSWLVDSAAPDTTISAAPSGAVAQGSASISFSASEAGSTFQCSLDGAAFAACTSPASLTGLADGTHAFQVRAVDAAGNVDATPAAASWAVDTVAPDTTITGGPSGNNNPNIATFTFTSTESPSTFECKLDAASFAACASPITYNNLVRGSHTFQVRARDAAGNVDATAATRSWSSK